MIYEIGDFSGTYQETIGYFEKLSLDSVQKKVFSLPAGQRKDFRDYLKKRIIEIVETKIDLDNSDLIME